MNNPDTDTKENLPRTPYIRLELRHNLGDAIATVDRIFQVRKSGVEVRGGRIAVESLRLNEFDGVFVWVCVIRFDEFEFRLVVGRKRVGCWLNVCVFRLKKVVGWVRVSVMSRSMENLRFCVNLECSKKCNWIQGLDDSVNYEWKFYALEICNFFPLIYYFRYRLFHGNLKIIKHFMNHNLTGPIIS